MISLRTDPGDPAAAARRRAALRARLAEQNLDALLVTDLRNVRYLTGFTGSNAALLVRAADEESTGWAPEVDPEDAATAAASLAGVTVLCTDGRYRSQSAQQVPDLPRLIARPCDLALVQHAPPGRVGFESHVVTVAGLAAVVGAAPAATELVPVDGLVEELRAVKDATEIEALTAACTIADRALADLIETGGIRSGRTERDIALDLDERMRRLGADGPAFDTIVAAGAHSAIPHHSPSSTALRTGDFVKLDFGAAFAGYHSDMTRTVILGPPADWQSEIHALVTAAQAAGRTAAVIGATGDQVDAAARRVIADAGHAANFVHGLGHGIGLAIHEAPSLARESAAIMSADMCVTIEPGVYLPGRGGVRIEDSGVIRPSGYEVITLTSKALLVL